MNRKPFLIRGCCLAVVLTLSLIPGLAGAQCSNSLSVDYLSDSGRAFGWSVFAPDTLLLRAGNSFEMDCDAHLTNIKVTIKRPSTVNRDIEPIAVGDLIRCEILDENKNLIMSETVPFPDTGVTALVIFPFWDREFRLSAGQYYFMVSPVEPRWGLLLFGEDYPDGTYQEDFAGSWSTLNRDAVFSTVWNPDSDLVATESRSLGTLKALYR